MTTLDSATKRMIAREDFAHNLTPAQRREQLALIALALQLLLQKRRLQPAVKKELRLQ